MFILKGGNGTNTYERVKVPLEKMKDPLGLAGSSGQITRAKDIERLPQGQGYDEVPQEMIRPELKLFSLRAKDKRKKAP